MNRFDAFHQGLLWVGGLVIFHMKRMGLLHFNHHDEFLAKFTKKIPTIFVTFPRASLISWWNGRLRSCATRGPVDLWPPWSESPRWWEMLKTRKMIYDHWPLYIYNYIIYVYTYIHILRWHTFYPDLKQNTFVFSVEVWRSPVAIGSKKIKNGAEDNSARSPPRRCRGECRWRMETARACRACRIRMRKSRTVNKMRIFQWKRWAEKRGGIINE